MGKMLVAVFAALYTAVRSLAVVGLAVSIGMLIASFICNIHAQETYSWISGIWHGFFVVPNYVRAMINSSILYKAQDFSTMYNIFWWIVVVLQIPTILSLLFKLVIAPIAAAIMIMVTKDN